MFECFLSYKNLFLTREQNRQQIIRHQKAIAHDLSAAANLECELVNQSVNTVKK